MEMFAAMVSSEKEKARPVLSTHVMTALLEASDNQEEQLSIYKQVHSLAVQVYPADSYMLTKLKIQSCPIYVRTPFQQVDRPLVSELDATAFAIYQLANLISNKEEISILVNATLLMAKSAFYQQALQQGRDLMSKARALAVKTLKDENETYLTFLMDYLEMALVFVAQDEFEIDPLLELHKEMVQLKAEIDKRGKIFEGFSDDKHAKFATIKYELFKRTKRTQETYQVGLVSIKSNFDHARTQNPLHEGLFDVMEQYALAINEFSYGDLSKAHALWQQANQAKKELLLKPLDEEQRAAISAYEQQCDPWGS